jgi:hypothetical protein
MKQKQLKRAQNHLFNKKLASIKVPHKLTNHSPKSQISKDSQQLSPRKALKKPIEKANSYHSQMIPQSPLDKKKTSS